MNKYVFLQDPTDPEPVYIQKTTYPAITARVVLLRDKESFADLQVRHSINSNHPCAVVPGYYIAIIEHGEIPTDRELHDYSMDILEEMAAWFLEQRISRKPKRYSANEAVD